MAAVANFQSSFDHVTLGFKSIQKKKNDGGCQVFIQFIYIHFYVSISFSLASACKSPVSTRVSSTPLGQFTRLIDGSLKMFLASLFGSIRFLATRSFHIDVVGWDRTSLGSFLSNLAALSFSKSKPSLKRRMLLKQLYLLLWFRPVNSALGC